MNKLSLILFLCIASHVAVAHACRPHQSLDFKCPDEIFYSKYVA